MVIITVVPTQLGVIITVVPTQLGVIITVVPTQLAVTKMRRRTLKSPRRSDFAQLLCY
jgi:hypothetical protein